MTGDRPVRIGISSCLLGEPVRFDGGHKRDGFLVDRLGPHVDWVPVCPEVEVGLPTPRPTLRLVQGSGGADVRLVSPKTGEDHTAAMTAYARERIEALAGCDLSGYVLKRGSPSCGMERVRVYGEAGMPARSGRGLFAHALLDRFPDLPVEEEGRLGDPGLRTHFLERVFAYRRLTALFADPGWGVGDLVAFHTAHKLTLMAHAPGQAKDLGRLVAGAAGRDRPELEAEYRRAFMGLLARRVSPGRHVNVLQHIVGYFKDDLDAATRNDILGVVDDYRAGLVDLVVPVTLIRHYVRRLGIDYLAGQAYLERGPKELGAASLY
ncbi:MAG TPA: DUF523 and DUF1722 domain-containing protein [Acidimicrobiia bacterium]|nr:DUF523 and DUF1722 domain-containing protein [Acidimicrobiia bacterium]